jgi:hypothetical protein
MPATSLRRSLAAKRLAEEFSVSSVGRTSQPAIEPSDRAANRANLRRLPEVSELPPMCRYRTFVCDEAEDSRDVNGFAAVTCSNFACARVGTHEARCAFHLRGDVGVPLFKIIFSRTERRRLRAGINGGDFDAIQEVGGRLTELASVPLRVQCGDPWWDFCAGFPTHHPLFENVRSRKEDSMCDLLVTFSEVTSRYDGGEATVVVRQRNANVRAAFMMRRALELRLARRAALLNGLGSRLPEAVLAKVVRYSEEAQLGDGASATPADASATPTPADADTTPAPA